MCCTAIAVACKFTSNVCDIRCELHQIRTYNDNVKGELNPENNIWPKIEVYI